MAYDFTEGYYLGDLVKYEATGYHSRDEVVLLAGDGAARSLVMGQVMGKVAVGAAAAVADAGNTGNGAVGEITLGPLAKKGAYLLTCVEAAADGGRFAVVSPDGYRLPDLTVGVAYESTDLNFTLADGDADFIVGDKITVTVPAGSGKWVPIDFAAVDGSQEAAGILLYDVAVPDGSDSIGVALTGHAEIAASRLVWPDGATADQKAEALARLRDLDIKTMKEA